MPFSKILHVFQTISLVALFILPISNRRPLSISPEFNSGSKHRSLCRMPSNKAYIVWHLLYPKKFRPFTKILFGSISVQNASKHLKKSNLYAKFAKILQKSAFFFKNICTIQK